jgi:hypothetical protein
MRQQEQIFISYRREGGDVSAKLICEALKNHGYTVFYDYDSLSGGYFDERIFDAIHGCKDFVLILPENSLDRCVNEDDWVRQEITCAFKEGKNIIPVMLPGFKFPTNLPKEIENVSRINAVQFVVNYFDSVMEAIIKRLKSRPVYEPVGSTPQSHDDHRSLIRNVCSFGSCDFNSTEPADAYYSEVIDRNRYNIVYFSITTAPMTDRSEINSQITIYDTKDNIVYEDSQSFHWEEGYNQLIRSWVIRGRDGSFVKAGKYKAVFKIDESKEYEYEFKVTAGSATEMDSSSSDEDLGVTASQDSGKWPRRFLACPKLFLFHILTSISLIFFAVMSETDTSVGTVIFFIAFVGFLVALFRATRKSISKNLIIDILLVTLGYIYYGIFLAFFSFLNIFLSSYWKKQIR